MDPFDVGGLLVARNRAIVRVVVGLGVAAFAGLLSLALYWNAGLEAQAAAEASPTGDGSGAYFVLWGPALWGLWFAWGGARVLWAIRKARSEFREFMGVRS
jgi:hypothetical protein